jgi:glycosyltransferase involved in cell wall biosynthesis
MKIGYLHLGPPQHGINRYGRMLATESQQRYDLMVLEAEAILTDNQIYNREVLLNAAKYLSQADLVHIQFSYFNDLLWGTGWRQLEHLQVFLSHCSCPIVATLHDVYYAPTGFKEIPKHILSLLSSKTENIGVQEEASPLTSILRKFFRAVKESWENNYGAATTALKELSKHADLILVCSKVEAQRLSDRVDPGKLKIVPHFVEPRFSSITPMGARKSLGLVEHRVITILGYVFAYKGHQLVVEAISYLPSDIQVIFAGSGDAETELVYTLMKLAEKNGVGHRLHLTGYLSEADLEKYLMATDLAICAFKEFSASGSISTWISVNCPILASDLPQISEYNEIEIDAIKIFKPYTPIALASAICQTLAEDQEPQKAKVASLGQKLSLSNIVDKHVTFYRAVNQSCDASPIYQV